MLCWTAAWLPPQAQSKPYRFCQTSRPCRIHTREGALLRSTHFMQGVCASACVVRAANYMSLPWHMQGACVA